MSSTQSESAARPAPPMRDAASIVIVRDGPSGLQVLLIQRAHASSFMGGAYVFPGGKLDASDCSPDWQSCLSSNTTTLHQRLAEPDLAPAQAQGLFIAAARETFEEAGLLLVKPSSSGHPEAVQQALKDWTLTAPVNEQWPHDMQQRGLQWNVEALLPWTRWIPPLQAPQRFDTRFFLARLPEGQTPRHDDHEAIHSLWIEPRQAIERYWAGDIQLVPPQLLSLAALSRYPDTQTLWQALSGRTPVCMHPKAIAVDGGHTVCYPGDPEHDVAERALEAPTRLRWTQKRFEPEGGLEGWFA